MNSQKTEVYEMKLPKNFEEKTYVVSSKRCFEERFKVHGNDVQKKPHWPNIVKRTK